jgi:NADP-dependent alcohol dehydrogenase
MFTFTFHRPTQIIFGEGNIEKLPDLISPKESILLLYGGGSIKKNGIYDRVAEVLRSYNVVEFGGIEANPHYETCLKAVKVIKEKNISFILAVGGGSVMDAGKFIALAAKLPEDVDVWQRVIYEGYSLSEALPVGVIPTLAATGSEMNQGYVISNMALHEKRASGNNLVMPKFAIMEPSATVSADLRQTSNGMADAYVHVLEQYLTGDEGETLQSSWAEGVLKSILRAAPQLMADLGDLEARASLMHAATMALNGMISMGTSGDWATHQIGHELTMRYGLDHARTLTIVMPNLWRVRKSDKLSRLAQYGRNVFGLSGSDTQVADLAISHTEAFFQSIQMPIHLSDADIPESAIDEISTRVRNFGEHFGEDEVVDHVMVKEILTLAK